MHKFKAGVRASAENFQEGGCNRKKDRKIAKKNKIAILSLFQEVEATKKGPKNSTIKPHLL